MNKNSIGANFTGSWSKRSKKYYSDKDAWKYFFKPDHSEYYPWSKKKVVDSPYPIDADYDTNVSNAESSRPEIDIHETNGVASIRVKTEQEITAELNPRKVINRWDSEKYEKHQKKELLDVMLMGDEYDQDLLPYRWSMQSTNKVEFYDPKRPHAVRRMRNTVSAKNSKTNNGYRPWQEERLNWWKDQILFDDMERNPDNQDIDTPMSPLKVILENHPNFIRDENKSGDQKQAA